jgi:peptidyl-prolyl cis-trans isomerase C
MSPRGEEATQEALDEYLRREALTQAIEGTDVLEQAAIEAELRELRKEMLISRYFDRFLRTAVTDDAIQNYYNEHAADYEDHEVHAAHILVRTNRRMSEEERQAASTRAQEAYAQLQTGRDFAEVAAQYSDDAVSSSRGGDLGWVRENAIDPRFSERAFATEAGAYTEPFETPFGWHIVKVLEAPATRHRPLSTVEGDIRYQLRAEAREAEIQRLLGTVEIAQREGGFRRRPRAGEPAPGEPGATAPSASAREPSVGETEEAPRAAAPTEPGTEHE